MHATVASRALSAVLLAFLSLAGPTSSSLPMLSPAGAAVQTGGSGGGRVVRMARSRVEWQRSMARLSPPARGCYTSTFPQIAWRKVTCVAPPNRPYPPHRGPRAFVVGNGTDFAAEVTGNMIGATGSFDSVSGVTSETGVVGGTGGQVANTYSLQLNTRPFTTTRCSSGGNPVGCRGWQQFIYSNAGFAFIQYWLLQYNATCPSGWNTFTFSGSTDIYCWRNGANSVSVPTQPIANLSALSLSGNAVNGGNDSVVMTTSGGSFTAANADNILNLASGWQAAEFVLVGDCCGSQANFNSGVTLAVRTVAHNNTTNAPTCRLEGYTGETNNLTLSGTPPVSTGPSPAIVSDQTNSTATAASCAAASGTGDTHLTTFGGLLYDFQAAGDFVLARVKPGFLVEARQISGAPTWPNATVNRAVAAQIGSSQVAICPALRVNGRAADLADGKTIVLPGDGDVSRFGNVYLIRDEQGNSVRAAVNAGYIDVSVGLGQWPAAVTGLLANAPRSVRSIVSRDGMVLTAPFAINELYGRYGDSWRVQANESLLVPCGSRGLEMTKPIRPFYAQDLERPVYERARGICVEAGVRAAPWLEACTLDVAFFNNSRLAAQVYVNRPKPAVVGRSLPARAGGTNKRAAKTGDDGARTTVGGSG